MRDIVLCKNEKRKITIAHSNTSNKLTTEHHGTRQNRVMNETD